MGRASTGEAGAMAPSSLGTVETKHVGFSWLRQLDR